MPDTYSTAVLADSPLAYYRLNEANMANGQSCADSSGNARNGTYTNNGLTAQYAALGDINKGAIQNTGGTGYVTTGTSAWSNFEYNTPFSIEFWFYSNSPSALTAEVEGIQKGDPIVANVPGFLIQKAASAAYFFSFWLYNKWSTNIKCGGNFYVAANVNNGAWHHVVATYDGSGVLAGMKVYCDGQLYTSLGGTYDALTSNTIAGSYPLNIGYYGNGAFLGVGQGLDEVAIYGTALSAARVLAHYQAAFYVHTTLVDTSPVNTTQAGITAKWYPITTILANTPLTTSHRHRATLTSTGATIYWSTPNIDATGAQSGHYGDIVLSSVAVLV